MNGSFREFGIKAHNEENVALMHNAMHINGCLQNAHLNFYSMVDQ
jgi:hypothetical protein